MVVPERPDEAGRVGSSKDLCVADSRSCSERCGTFGWMFSRQNRWVEMGTPIKEDDKPKPIFQEDFARIIPDRDQL